MKTGADFQNYIQDLVKIGVLHFETFVSDSRSDYYGVNNFKTSSAGIYHPLEIANILNIEAFKKDLKQHQQGKTDYAMFVNGCAKYGVFKWVMNLNDMTCIYYDKGDNLVLLEIVPH